MVRTVPGLRYRPGGKGVERTRKVVLGLKSELRKYQAEEKLQEIIRRENGKQAGEPECHPRPDESVTFGWFVAEKYLPIRRGQWRPATRKKTEFEINKYLVDKFKNIPLKNIGLFELQILLNDLAEKYSESIVKHAFVNLRSILRMAQKLKFIFDNPGEETKMPEPERSIGPRSVISRQAEDQSEPERGSHSGGHSTDY